MVEHPGEYRWSSYGHNAQGLADAVIRPHALHTGLGSTAPLRARRRIVNCSVTSSTRGWWTRYVRQPKEVSSWERNDFRKRSLQCLVDALGGAVPGGLSSPMGKTRQHELGL
jgi:hypothetical protein